MGLSARLSPRHESRARGSRSFIDLAGWWSFALDPGGVGITEGWFGRDLEELCRLPGSTDENGFGTPVTRPGDHMTLQRLREYTGAAWYQCSLEIPADWRGRRVELFLERAHWETQAWLDDRWLGMRDSLCTPHVYALTDSARPGRHRLTVRVDNRLKYDLGAFAHSVSEQSQTNWNGLIGRLELRSTAAVWIDDLQVYPDCARRVARVRVGIGNRPGRPVRGAVVLRAEGPGDPPPVRVPLECSGTQAVLEAELPMGPEVRFWDEFDPVLYALTASIETGSGGPGDALTVSFGMRELKAAGRRLQLNGRNIFLRGTLECCVFPLTGRPPMDPAEWSSIFRAARSYGLNHMRFHSWCPPEAAFEAADRAGFLLHVEAPQWVQNAGQDPPRDAFIEEEVRRILRACGNHPSFGMLCMGNELDGDRWFLERLVQRCHELDPRPLYASATAWVFGPHDDFNVPWRSRGVLGPATDGDFRAQLEPHRVPCISHEVGQWAVFPDIEEIDRYSGVLRSSSLELIRQRLADRRLLDQAHLYTHATGRLMLLLYKEEIEAQLRTPDNCGFQLLDLHDFPGQGTATVGVLNAFWGSKGLIEPEAFRRFCGPTVPLLRMPRRVYTAGERFRAAIEVAHYGPADLEGARAVWSIHGGRRRPLAGGALPVTRIPTGGLSGLGTIDVPLEGIQAPVKLTVGVSLAGTPFANEWEIWVYPPAEPPTPDGDVLVLHRWDDIARQALRAGRSVLLLATGRATIRTIPGSFTPVFWSPVWFPHNSDTMGILCDPAHPALRLFPTEMHTNWQWHDLLQTSRTLPLDDTPTGFRPIVQVIDSFVGCRRLGNLFECRVGPGRLLVCTMDLLNDLDRRPAACQMLRSLLSHACSAEFSPARELPETLLDGLLAPLPQARTSVEPPAGLSAAVLRVRAATGAPADLPWPWAHRIDEVLASAKGFSYGIEGQAWRDAGGSAWISATGLTLRIHVPGGFAGRLCVHFHDWQNQGRAAEVFLGETSLGCLPSFGGPGVWLEVPVRRRPGRSEPIALSARPLAGPGVAVTGFALVP